VYRTEPREITESFRLERVLKSSRSAIVFRAVEPGTGTTVAIKLIPPSSPANLEACRERFLAVMGVLASKAPDAFPALLDYGFCPDGSAFMVMEIVEGERLDTLTGPPPERVLHLIVHAVAGLEVLASSGVCHGNIAPENILAVSHGEREGVRILGFGTVAFHGSIAGVGGAILAEGPAQFAAPEQLDPATASVSDWRSDLYAIAATACNLLRAEVVPADAPAPEVTLPPHVRANLADPAALQAILAHSLRRDPGARPASFDEFRQGVRRALSAGPAEPQPAPEAATRTLALNVAALLPPTDGGPAPQPAAAESVAEPETGAGAPPPSAAPAEPPPPDDATRLLPLPEVAPPEEAPAEIELTGNEPTGAVPLRHLEPVPEAPAPFVEPPTGAIELPAPPVSEPEALRARAEEPPTLPPAVEAPAAPAAPASAPAPVEGAPLPPAEAPPEQPQPVAAPATPVAKPKRKGRAVPLAIGAAAVIVLGSAAGLFWLWRQQSQRPAPPVVPTAVPRRPSPSPQPAQASPAVALIERAEAALALGDLPGAAAALDAVAPTDLAGLPQADQDRYNTLKDTYSTQRRQAVTKEMQRALSAGNLKTLSDAVRGISREEETSFKRDADFSASLDEARRVITVQTALLKAQRQGDQAQVLESASVLAGLVPRYAQASEAREKAAAALEREADALAAKGNFDGATAELEVIRRNWPSRAGLSGRLERVKEQQEAEQKFKSLLAQVEQTAADKVPEKGLELLKSMPQDPRTADRVQKLREQLTKQLEQLDAQPPTIGLASGFKLEYKKGEPVTLPVKIQDDHGVKSAQLFARVEGSGRFVELPLRHVAGSDWTAEISASFHQNQTIEFYIVATDHSGHVAQFGKAQEPIKLKRKKNIFGF